MDDVTPRLLTETKPPQRAARVLLAVALVGLGGWTLQHYLSALAWAAVIAIGTWPLYERAQRRWPPGRHNILIPAVFTACVALLFLVPLVIVGVEAAREAHTVTGMVNEARTNGLPVPGFVPTLPLIGHQAATWWGNNLSDPQASGQLLHKVDNGEMMAFSRRLGAQVLERVVLFGFTLLTLFLLFRQGRDVTNQALTASRRAFGPSGERIGRQMVASVRGTMNGLVLVGLGEGVLLGIVYGFTHVPHPVLFGMFTAAAAMVPFGTPVVFGLAALLLLVQGSTTAAIILLVIGFVITFTADHAVRPVLIGGATRLPFLWVLLGILGGIEVWGLLGLFLGPAIMAALILLWREWTDPASVQGPLPGTP